MPRHSQAVVISDEGDAVRVEGALTFATVPPLAASVNNWLMSGDKPKIVDLSRVTRSDSAGIALLLQWLGDARAAGFELKFTNIPNQVEDFIRINGLAQLLID